MKKYKAGNINYAIPGNALNQRAFEKMIKDAESGTFHTIGEVKAEFEKWKAKYQSSAVYSNTTVLFL